MQYTIEGLFAVRKSGFADFPSVPEELDLVDRNDQVHPSKHMPAPTTPTTHNTHPPLAAHSSHSSPHPPHHTTPHHTAPHRTAPHHTTPHHTTPLQEAIDVKGQGQVHDDLYKITNISDLVQVL